MAKKSNGLAVYNRILREFTKINKQLPEERQLSVADRRKIITESIYPKYKGAAKSKISAKTLKGQIIYQIQRLPPKETCDPNYIDPSVYRTIDAFAIDEFLQTVIPNCIYVKLQAGDLGETKIFNTRNYSYNRSGVKKIIENIREFAKEMTSQLDWTGVQKLRPHKADDGTPENYYIEFVLNINGEPTGDMTPVMRKPPKEKQKVKTKVTNIIQERISKIRTKKKKVGRAKKSVSKTAQQLSIIRKKIKKLKTPKGKSAYIELETDIMTKALAKLKKNYEEKGLFSKEEYEKLRSKIINSFGAGGEVK